jgi:hypothetical protein
MPNPLPKPPKVFTPKKIGADMKNPGGPGTPGAKLEAKKLKPGSSVK